VQGSLTISVCLIWGGASPVAMASDQTQEEKSSFPLFFLTFEIRSVLFFFLFLFFSLLFGRPEERAARPADSRHGSVRGR
jgi:hypothetical protein